MDPAEQARFDTLLFAMTQAMKLHGLRDKTIDSYRRTIYRVAGHFRRCPDNLAPDELKEYFSALLERYSWSTIKVDLSSLQFFSPLCAGAGNGMGQDHPPAACTHSA